MMADRALGLPAVSPSSALAPGASTRWIGVPFRSRLFQHRLPLSARCQGGLSAPATAGHFGAPALQPLDAQAASTLGHPEPVEKQFVDSSKLVKELLAPEAPARGGSPPYVPTDIRVPDHHLVADPAQLDLIGEGLPIIDGPEWPQMYAEALSKMARGESVSVPTPHPKFSLQVRLWRLVQGGGGGAAAQHRGCAFLSVSYNGFMLR